MNVLNQLTRWGALGAAVATALAPGQAEGQGTSTQVMIRATSHDAKIIGSGVGGARISVYDASTGALLASGIQEGATGSTPSIVLEPRTRGQSVFDTESAAGFMAVLDIEQPTHVRIEAEGPLGTPHATQKVTKTMLLIPGQDVLGDGVILEMYGFTVELLEPGAERLEPSGQELPVRARVTMLCGCPTEPGGIWDSDAYTIEARVVQGAKVLERAVLSFSGETSVFEGSVRVPEGEGLVLQVLAMDAAKGNFGIVERTID